MRHLVANLPFAEKMAKDFVCSICFGSIAFGFDSEKIWVECRNSNCDGIGFVTKAYAERRRIESRIDKLDAMENLKDILPGPKSDLSEEELIKRLYG